MIVWGLEERMKLLRDLIAFTRISDIEDLSRNRGNAGVSINLSIFSIFSIFKI